jgi:peroxiredoxin
MRCVRTRTAIVSALLLITTGLLAGCDSGATKVTTAKPSSGSSAGSVATTLPPSVVREAAPDFSGVTLDGTEVSLSQYRGKPLVLAFIASWCGTCAAEAPGLDEFYREEAGRAAVLAMDVDDGEDAIRQFMADGGWTFPVMLDADEVFYAYGARYLGTVFVIDSEGGLVKMLLNQPTAAELSTLIDGLTP